VVGHRTPQRGRGRRPGEWGGGKGRGNGTRPASPAIPGGLGETGQQAPNSRWGLRVDRGAAGAVASRPGPFRDPREPTGGNRGHSVPSRGGGPFPILGGEPVGGQGKGRDARQKHPRERRKKGGRGEKRDGPGNPPPPKDNKKHLKKAIREKKTPVGGDTSPAPFPKPLKGPPKGPAQVPVGGGAGPKRWAAPGGGGGGGRVDFPAQLFQPPHPFSAPIGPRG